MADVSRILIVDDEQKIREVVKEYALFEGYEVDEAADGMEAIEKVKNARHGYDCIIMDIMMPRLDGYSACKEIKKYSSAPVIMLSARGEEYDKLFGFEVGIDDYVVKPFSPKELMARVKVAIKRRKSPDSVDILRYKGLEINFAAREVIIDGKKAQMTPKEYDILFYLAKNMNIAMSREKLLEEVWGYDFYGDDRTVDTHIKMLRNSLGPYRDLIVTLRGMGYKFDNINKREEDEETVNS
ncbi:MAG: response regulator transcription factor [Oscillospiraceae bacterium]|nr:response regulator transcription factor [Oscillospiraceae bacterium]